VKVFVAELWQRGLRRRSQKGGMNGSESRAWPMTGGLNRKSCILGRKHASPSHTRGGSRMRESRSSGCVPGARRNERPYRELVEGALATREQTR
jgi:hypothetical protein